jgi:hypothetical protein
MAKSLPQQKLRIGLGKSYSLRTLFLVSAVIAIPFLLFANLRHNLRPEDSVGSPLYLLLGIGGVVLAAIIGSAVGSRSGMFTAACLAALCWIALVLMGGLFSKELMAVLPVHALCAAAALVVMTVVVRPGKGSNDEGPHEMLLKLLRVKHDVEVAQQAKKLESRPAISSIQTAHGGPDSRTQN